MDGAVGCYRKLKSSWLSKLFKSWELFDEGWLENSPFNKIETNINICLVILYPVPGWPKLVLINFNEDQTGVKSERYYV